MLRLRHPDHDLASEVAFLEMAEGRRRIVEAEYPAPPSSAISARICVAATRHCGVRKFLFLVGGRFNSSVVPARVLPPSRPHAIRA